MSENNPVATPSGDLLPFVETTEFHRFAEFCDDCQRYRYIGLCYGAPGVGKTLSARHYSHWDLIEAQLHERFDTFSRLPEAVIAHSFRIEASARPAAIIACRSVFYTPKVANSPRQIENEVWAYRVALSSLVHDAEQVQSGENRQPQSGPDRTELLIVDEADRLKTVGLEQIRDIYDRHPLGVVLIGMPGLEKRLARYPQLSSRVGFVHQYRQLSAEDTQQILEEQWRRWGVTLQAKNWHDADAVAAIVRMTGGNFRLVQRLLSQIERIVEINALTAISKEVVEVAREQLVIGLT